jgi:hypothetical protein
MTNQKFKMETKVTKKAVSDLWRQSIREKDRTRKEALNLLLPLFQKVHGAMQKDIFCRVESAHAEISHCQIFWPNAEKCTDQFLNEIWTKAKRLWEEEVGPGGIDGSKDLVHDGLEEFIKKTSNVKIGRRTAPYFGIESEAIILWDRQDRFVSQKEWQKVVSATAAYFCAVINQEACGDLALAAKKIGKIF